MPWLHDGGRPCWVDLPRRCAAAEGRGIRHREYTSAGMTPRRWRPANGDRWSVEVTGRIAERLRNITPTASDIDRALSAHKER